MQSDIRCSKAYATYSQVGCHGTGHDASSRDMEIQVQDKVSSFMPTFMDYNLGTQTTKSQSKAMADVLREEKEATLEKGPLISFLGYS